MVTGIEPTFRNRALFEPITEDLVLASMREYQKKVEEKRAKQYDEYENWYMGGDLVTDYLYRNEAESDESYATRKKRLAHMNYVGRIIDEIVDDAYGGEVDRKFGPTATPAQEQMLGDVIERSNMLDTQQEICRATTLLGDGWGLVSYSEEQGGPVIYPVHPGDVGYWLDKNNPRDVIRMIERRTEQSLVGEKLEDVVEYWIWTPFEYARLDAKMRYIEEPTPHAIGAVPYIRWKGRGVVGEIDGLSYARDMVGIQKLILNRTSDVDKLVQRQCHGLLVIKDIDAADVKTGADWFIRLSGPNADAKYINPGADIKSAADSLTDLVSRMFEIGSVPMSLVRGGQASSGLQLAIEMRPLTRIVATVRAKARVAETQLIRLICRVGNAYGSGWPDPAALRPNVAFNENFLPSDKDKEFERDLVMLNNMPQLMTIESFVRKWRPELLGNDEAIKAYLDELDVENKKAGSVGSGTLRNGGSSGGGAPGGGGGDVPQGENMGGSGKGEQGEAQPGGDGGGP